MSKLSTFELYRRSGRDHFASMAPDMVALVKAVYDYADAHYNDGGWDVIVECWEPAVVADVLDASMTEPEAIDVFRPAAAVWAERERVQK